MRMIQNSRKMRNKKCEFWTKFALFNSVFFCSAGLFSALLSSLKVLYDSALTYFSSKNKKKKWFLKCNGVTSISFLKFWCPTSRFLINEFLIKKNTCNRMVKRFIIIIMFIVNKRNIFGQFKNKHKYIFLWSFRSIHDQDCIMGNQDEN